MVSTKSAAKILLGKAKYKENTKKKSSKHIIYSVIKRWTNARSSFSFSFSPLSTRRITKVELSY